MKCDSVARPNSTMSATSKNNTIPSFTGPTLESAMSGQMRLFVRYQDASIGSSVPVVMSVFASVQDCCERSSAGDGSVDFVVMREENSWRRRQFPLTPGVLAMPLRAVWLERVCCYC